MPSVRRRGSRVRAPGGPAGVPGPSGARLDGPGARVTKRSTLCHVLSGWRVGRQEARKRHSQTVNTDLSLPDRGGELGLASTHKARGPDPEARDRRRRLVVEPEAAGEAQTNAGGVYVKMIFSSAAGSRSVVERSHTRIRSLRTHGYRPAPRPYHPSCSLTDRRRLCNP